jgi:hypothetical protein
MERRQLWVDPTDDFAMVIVTNIGGEKPEGALFKLAPVLYARFAPTK